MAEILYRLEVCILEGVGSVELCRASPPDVRAIEVLGEQTLQQLHGAILQAFDRWDDWADVLHEHRPHDCGSIRWGYRSPLEAPDPFDAGQPVGDAAKTSISSLGLKAGQSFGYWFDLWDGWHHEIKVLAIGDAHPRLRAPRTPAQAGTLSRGTRYSGDGESGRSSCN